MAVPMTSTLIVDGGAPLVGEVEVRGAKNLVSKAMVAVLLAEEPCRLRGVPEISDVRVVSGLLELHGVLIDSTDRDGELVLDPRRLEQAQVEGQPCDKTAPAPALPDTVISNTAAKYREALHRLTAG